MDPLVTIYITNYNYENFIEQAINSVLEQSYSNIELYIIDDGSTDNSKEKIEKYASLQNVNIVYQQNKGLNTTNNIALRLANGKYIVRLDADDYLVMHAIELMVNVLESDKDLGLVFPDYFLIDKNNIILSEIKRHDFRKDVKLYDQPAHGACTMIRVAFLKELGGYNEAYSCQDGYELWIKFIAKFKVTNLPQPLFHYRQHGNNLTSNENRILATRRSINSDFINQNKIELPVTIGIIPIRETTIDRSLIALKKFTGKTLLDIKIESALQSRLLQEIIVTSDLIDIENHITQQYSNNDRVKFVKRPKKLARYNVSLIDTIKNVFNESPPEKTNKQCVMILPIEYPFLKTEMIDDAIHVLKIFDSNSLISVRPEYKTIYQHHGEGMVPISDQEKLTQFEREALYKSAGGITMTYFNDLLKSEKILNGKVGHIVVDDASAFGIFTEFDLKLARHLLNDKIELIGQHS